MVLWLLRPAVCYGLFVNPNSEQIKRSKYFWKLFARLSKEFEFFIFLKTNISVGKLLLEIFYDCVCVYYIERRKKWNF